MKKKIRLILFLGNKTRVFEFAPEDGDIHVFVQGEHLHTSVTQQTELEFEEPDDTNLLSILKI